METRKFPFVGVWRAVRQEYRAPKEWHREYDYEPEEWQITFFPDGKYGEILRFAGEIPKTGTWTPDAETGIISLRHDDTPQFVQKCIFDSADEEAYLYYYDGARHTRFDSRSIIEYHAHTRIRLVRAGV